MREHRSGSMGYVDNGRSGHGGLLVDPFQASGRTASHRDCVAPVGRDLSHLPQDNRNWLMAAALQHATEQCFDMLGFLTRRSEPAPRFRTGSRR